MFGVVHNCCLSNASIQHYIVIKRDVSHQEKVEAQILLHAHR